MGIDATDKLPGETNRPWGRRLERSATVIARVDALWQQLGLA
jgi:4-hydroxy-3-polyprenylbenzoate decarboxylase